jgi:DNA-binding NtrC family response regulator
MLTKSACTLLVIDDDLILGLALKDGMAGPAREVLVATSAAEGLHVCRSRKVDVVLLDQNLPDGEGTELCPKILEANDGCKIIFITGYPEFSHAVKAIKAGAFDYLSKPFEFDELVLVVDRALKTRALERIEAVEKYRASRDSADAVFVGGGAGMREVEHLVSLAAQEEVPVLITGETGTGKNVAAKAIHYRGERRDAPFVSINCAALPENLIEAELFGFERGAFTGATCSKPGLFEVAEGGTLFLDEIGELPLQLQAKLLGVLEDRIIRRLGGTVARPLSVRILAATNLDLAMALRRKIFREDLFYRLNVLQIQLPPLRDRPEDLPALCGWFIRQAARGREIHLPDDELAMLREYHWPGNVRELKNIIERAVILQRDGTIRPYSLLRCGEMPVSPPAEFEENLLPLEKVEERHIRFVLERCGNNFTRTAKVLQVGLSTLKRKMKRYTQ